MRHLVSFLVVVLCSLSVQSLPLPDVIQYSVPSKFFGQNGSKPNSFYDILKQIHFGGAGSAAEQTSSLDHVTTTSSNENVDVKATITPMDVDVTNSNESPEAPVVTDDVTDDESKEHQQHEEIDTTIKDNSADNDETFTALIEKVVSEQIEKLASEFDAEIKINLSNERNEVIEKSDLVHESNAMSNTEKAQLDNDKDDHEDDDDRVSETTMTINSEMDVAEDENKEKHEDEIVATTSGMSIIESVDLDSESESTIMPTNPPEQTTNMDTHEQHKDDAESNAETFVDDEKDSEETSSKKEIPEALLNAVGDLLSSVLGVSVTSIKNGLFIPTADATTSLNNNVNENIHTEGSATTESDIVEHSTEQDLSSSTSALELNENNEEEEIKTEATDVQNSESDMEASVAAMPQESDEGTIANEIDLKIENLGNVHDTNFMTEDTPEVFTETVKELEMGVSSDQAMPVKEPEMSSSDGIEEMPAVTANEESVMEPEVTNEALSVPTIDEKTAIESEVPSSDDIKVETPTVNEDTIIEPDVTSSDDTKELPALITVEESIKEPEMPSSDDIKVEAAIVNEDTAMVPVVPSSDDVKDEAPIVNEDAAMEPEVSSLDDIKVEAPTVNEDTAMEPVVPSSDDIKDEITIIEALPALTVEEESVKPVSFEESINHVMNLVKDTEENLDFENAQNILNSVFIDHKTVNDNVNHILKSALKEIETNFGMTESEIEKEIQIPTDALEMLDREREEMIKNFETDINESLSESSIDQEDLFEPNMAKAALFHKFQYDDDF